LKTRACRNSTARDNFHFLEEAMWKAVFVGATALAIAGTSLVYAQQPGGPDARQRWRPSAEDVAALADARIAALKAGLKLTAEQEKHWPAVENAMRELAKARADRVSARRDAPRPSDPIERMRTRADFMSTRGADLKRLADAAEPLYKSLDEAQKRRFELLARPMRAHRFASAGGPGDDAGWRGRGWRGRYHERGWRGPDDRGGPDRMPGPERPQ
jgi:hypothetical protein